MKVVHLAKMIRHDGAVSPWCAKTPRALNLKTSIWRGLVTCEKCLEIEARERGKVVEVKT